MENGLWKFFFDLMMSVHGYYTIVSFGQRFLRPLVAPSQLLGWSTFWTTFRLFAIDLPTYLLSPTLLLIFFLPTVYSLFPLF